MALTTETPAEVTEAQTGPLEVLHIFACWEFHRRMPRPGDRAACGWMMPLSAEPEYTPARGNEHKACVVCMEVTGQNRWRRRLGRWWRGRLRR